MSETKIPTIIPVYNIEKYLRESLKSCASLRQSPLVYLKDICK